MPGSYLYPSERARYRYIANVLDVLVLRDVEEKHGVRNKVQLERACDFLMDNIGNISSVGGTAAALDAAGTRVSVATLAQYLGYLCQAFAFYRVRRYDVGGKKYLPLRVINTIYRIMQSDMQNWALKNSTSGMYMKIWSL